MILILQGAVSLGLLWAVMTIGVFITYRILDYADLTVEGSITTGASVAATLISGGWNPYAATFLAMISGMVAGLATGLLHTKLKIPPLLSGILSMIALYSINLRIMGKANISLLKTDTIYTPFINLGLGSRNAVILFGLICVVILIALLYWFFGTEIGCAIRATGNNPNMIRAQGVNTDSTKILGLVISNGLVALAGALIAQYQSFSDVGMGIGSIVIGLASVIIGEVLFGTRNFLNTLISLVLGAITYRVIIALVLEMGMRPTDLRLFTAITVTVALSLPLFRGYLNTFIRSAKNEKGGA
ncbi:ABC transporter permease [Papillibacter cinnamivorans]|uniref:Putative ABC transport system permease protein n=1 Tax=Papillibacter cinnamivorans DSM 12816 TaxID=1122930 RepID=A0A1W1ZHA0_9FIRM|nr:ABC transporter permease [Papillibacter cinnamivorans]SMC47859.1 putative ABC transport system permease protein [Papillibacter cinnamivorans DSM 12816]